MGTIDNRKEALQFSNKGSYIDTRERDFEFLVNPKEVGGGGMK
jgi:hypothetical protein